MRVLRLSMTLTLTLRSMWEDRPKKKKDTFLGCDTLASHPLSIYTSFVCVCVAYNNNKHKHFLVVVCFLLFFWLLFFLYIPSSEIYIIIMASSITTTTTRKASGIVAASIHLPSSKVPSELVKSSTALFSAYSSSGGDNKSVTLPDLPYDYNALERTFVFVYVFVLSLCFLCCFLSCDFC